MRAMILLLAVFIAGCSSHWVKQEESGATLYLKARDATSVMFYCSLDGYTPRRVDESRKGVWRVVVPVDRECRYFYRVDGQVVIPPSPRREFDDFGGETCVYSPDRWGLGGEK
ncbi:hypothetical protein [Desulfoluna sp.]|uniref:hypothetical protein n=1 Tax=Desulfoluna sp. TaxID=2045199 RepID=UPI00261CF096|nr:hypothetical protein [Desulfoluna sp.]